MDIAQKLRNQKQTNFDGPNVRQGIIFFMSQFDSFTRQNVLRYTPIVIGCFHRLHQASIKSEKLPTERGRHRCCPAPHEPLQHSMARDGAHVGVGSYIFSSPPQPAKASSVRSKNDHGTGIVVGQNSPPRSILKIVRMVSGQSEFCSPSNSTATFIIILPAALS